MSRDCCRSADPGGGAQPAHRAAVVQDAAGGATASPPGGVCAAAQPLPAQQHAVADVRWRHRRGAAPPSQLRDVIPDGHRGKPQWCSYSSWRGSHDFNAEDNPAAATGATTAATAAATTSAGGATGGDAALPRCSRATEAGDGVSRRQVAAGAVRLRARAAAGDAGSQRRRRHCQTGELHCDGVPRRRLQGHAHVAVARVGAARDKKVMMNSAQSL